MSNSTKLIFKAIQIISWIFFIMLLIDAGTLLINFLLKFIQPEWVNNFYETNDLNELFEKSQAVFIVLFGFALLLALLKANLFYHVVQLIQKLDLNRPFSAFVSKQISKLSYITLSIGLISHIARQVAKNLSKYGYELDNLNFFWVDSQAFILMAAVIYLIAFIFKKGLEIQMENDLTI